MDVGPELGRVRVVCADAAGLRSALSRNDPAAPTYFDLLLAPDLDAPAGFVRQGIDIDIETGTWGTLWQADNQVREEGLRGSLDLSVSLERIAGQATAVFQGKGA